MHTTTSTPPSRAAMAAARAARATIKTTGRVDGVAVPVTYSFTPAAITAAAALPLPPMVCRCVTGTDSTAAPHTPGCPVLRRPVSSPFIPRRGR